MDQWLTEDQIHVRLAQAIQNAGSAQALAQQWNISSQFLGDVRHRRRNLTNAILDRLGIEKVVKYRVSEGQS